MITLLANPLVRKALIYVGIGLLALYGFRLWLNKHDNLVYQQGKEAVAEEQRIKYEAALKQEREAIAAEKLALTKVVDQLNKDMVLLQGSLNESIKQSKVHQAGNSAAVNAIPDSQLNGAIRSELRRQQPPHQ